jgi:S1-C subfamily serine protease
VNSSGHLVGINLTAPLRGVALSAPIHRVRERLNRLQAGQRLEIPKPGYLGLQLAPLPTAARQTARIPGGVLVTQVLPGFSGHRAGILRGDIIVRIGTQPIALYEQLKGWLMTHPAGTQTTIHVLRKQKQLHFPIVLEDPPQ